MVLAIDFRTDIPACYSDWIINRFKEGFLYFRNPAYPNTLHKVILDRDHIEGIIWCSKNYLPIMEELHSITDVFPSIFHYTITGYERDVEPFMSTLDWRLHALKTLSNIYGNDHVVWRYDPIFINSTYTKEWHLQNFESLCKEMTNNVERCVINFISLYEKVKRHMPGIQEVSYDDKLDIVKRFLEISKRYNIKLQTCGNGLQFKNLKGVEITGCLDHIALGKMGIHPKKRTKASDWGCLCYPHTAIGEYNTCLHKCKYCYASANFDKVDDNFDMHDPESPLLIGWPKGDEKIIEMQPKLIGTDTKQLSIEF